MLKLNLWQSSPPGKIRKAPAPALSLGVDVRHLIFEGGEYSDGDGDDHDMMVMTMMVMPIVYNVDRDVVMYVTTNCRSPPTISLVWSLK